MSSVNNPLKAARDSAIPSTINLEALAHAMQQLDLSSVPAHKTADAIRDHLHRVMASTALYPSDRLDAQLARAAIARQSADLAIARAVRLASIKSGTKP